MEGWAAKSPKMAIFGLCVVVLSTWILNIRRFSDPGLAIVLLFRPRSRGVLLGPMGVLNHQKGGIEKICFYGGVGCQKSKNGYFWPLRGGTKYLDPQHTTL